MSAGAELMIKKLPGRPLHVDAVRTPSGQKSRARPDEPYVPLATIRLMISAGKAHGRWSSWLGRETIAGRISEMQYQAAVRYAHLAGLYREVIGAPPLTAQAQDVGRARGRSGGEEDVERTQTIIRRWNEAQAVLSPAERYVMDHVVVRMLENEGAAHAQILRMGLDRLLWLWEGKRKS